MISLYVDKVLTSLHKVLKSSLYTMGGGCKNTCAVRWGGEYSRVEFGLGSPLGSRDGELVRGVPD